MAKKIKIPEPLTINELVADAYAIAYAKGWWMKKEWNFGEKIALIHSELSEALEEARQGNWKSYIARNTEKPLGLPVELADVVIRIADLCGKMGIDLEKEIRNKMEYNKTRPFRHGGKKF